MIAIKLTEEIIDVLDRAEKVTVFSEILSTYEVDDENLYIPEERIKDKSILEKLIKEGLAFRA